MRLSYKNRISLLFLLTTALIMALVYAMVYTVVYITVYDRLDSNLEFEVLQHKAEVSYQGENIIFINKQEWEERGNFSHMSILA